MKQKTHSGAKKRIKITGSGKKLFQKAAQNHLLSSKSSRQKKVSRLGQVLSSGTNKVMSKLLKTSR
ncbi:50S ribosomal protein L35 [bacterium]|jgi:large subunit ribosomal protein L35|nr:50S ribosomal protein L35 [bacterium]MBT6831881.1 50S ribosomal protein L35 [bacterium]MBT6995971.1 50S ribosomal protein L35 [bacterium]MBT7772246.1 50S ribosomal protein L35 [bacterium]